jgi:hypothetical protein
LEATSVKHTQNSPLAIIFNRRTIIIFCLFIICVSAFTIERRINLTVLNQIQDAANMQKIAMCMPFLLMVCMYIFIYKPNNILYRFLNKILRYEVIATVCLIGILACYYMFSQKSAVRLGSWPSDAVIFSGMLILFLILKDRMSNTYAVIASAGLLGIWTGVWEVPYQTFLKIYYDMPQIGTMMGMRWIVWEWVIELPMAGIGAVIIWELNRMFHFIQFNKWVWIFLALYAVCMIYWVLSGYWVDDYYNWTLRQQVFTSQFNGWALFVTKLSKVFMMLAIVKLVWHKNES